MSNISRYFILTSLMLIEFVVFNINIRSIDPVVYKNINLSVIVNLAVLICATLILVVCSIKKSYEILYGLEPTLSQQHIFLNYITFGVVLLFFSSIRICMYSTHMFEKSVMASATILAMIGLMMMNVVMVFVPRDLQTVDGRRRQQLSKTELNKKIIRHVIFLEGTSGLGKTTIANVSLDFTEYRKQHAFYANKDRNITFQIMYDWHILLDSITEIMNAASINTKECIYSQNYILVDRSFISQLVYSLISTYNGDSADPDKFALSVDGLLNNVEFCEVVKRLTHRWFRTFQSMVDPNVSVGIQWFVAADARYTEKSIRERDEFDAKIPGMIIENYIKNQNYLFERMYEICGLGSLCSVYHISESDISVKASKRRIKSIRFSV